MKILLKTVLLAVTLSAVQIGLIESKRHHSEDNKQCSSDICSLGDNCVLKCFCELRQNATDCLVFNGNLSSSSDIWETFTSQSYLQTLSLRGTGTESLKDIPTKTVQRLSNLQNLTIKLTPIKHIKINAFASSKSLKEIYLIGNQITRLDSYSIANLVNLVTLNLEENEISELRRGVFINLPNLRKLSLSYNNLTIIHERCFNNLTGLKELNLRANDISTLTKENFQGLIQLETLDLSRNELKMLGSHVFSHVTRLRSLVLGDNKIEVISEMALSGLVKLEQISLESNRIQFLPARLFEVSGFLADVDLRNNQLHSLTNETVSPVVGNIIRLEKGILRLDGNQFRCDCSLFWAQRLHNTTSNRQLRECLSNITCYPDAPPSRRLTGLASTATPHTPARTYTYETDNRIAYNPDRRDSVGNHMYQDESSKKNVELIRLPLVQMSCPENLKKEHSVDEPTTKEVRNNPSSSSKIKAHNYFVIIALILTGYYLIKYS